MKEITRDPSKSIIFSIFDDDCFYFYVMKYCEIFGYEALLSIQDNLNYGSKIKMISFILDSELELGVDESSWKHCLIFLLQK